MGGGVTEASHPHSSEEGKPENPGELLFKNNLSTIDWAIRHVCQKHGLSIEEAEEFRAHVHLKLMDDGYAVLRKFRGDSKLATFLVSTISYRCQDYRNALWGKWRPSAKAVRMGGQAPLIEQLTHRDDHTDDEAFEILRMNHRVTITRAEFEAILAQLPARDKRRFESEDVLETLASPGSAEGDLLAEEKRVHAERLLQATYEELSRLPPAHRLLIKLFDEDGLHMRQVAAIVGGEASALFRRRERIWAGIRKRLKIRGFDIRKDPE
jgi:RNA polymerase sigma factor (sigma-70 family)